MFSHTHTWLAQTDFQSSISSTSALSFVFHTAVTVVFYSYSMTSMSLCFQAATKESNAEERLTPVVLAQQAAQLKQQLVSAHLDSLLGPQAHINLADPDGALAR